MRRLLLIFVLLAACSNSNRPGDTTTNPNPAARTAVVSMNKNDYPVFPDADAGADPAVSADQGGKGFKGDGAYPVRFQQIEKLFEASGGVTDGVEILRRHNRILCRPLAGDLRDGAGGFGLGMLAHQLAGAIERIVDVAEQILLAELVEQLVFRHREHGL